MDSYEKIRRMGEIQKSLKKHGLVTDSEEALKEAESYMKKSPDENLYVSREQMEKMQVKKEEPKEEDVEKMDSKINDRLNDVNSQLDLIRDKMNEIITKINELENKLNSQPRQEVQATLSSRNREERVEREEPKPAAKKEVPRQRPGEDANYTMDEVAVDKIFYVGK